MGRSRAYVKDPETNREVPGVSRHPKRGYYIRNPNLQVADNREFFGSGLSGLNNAKNRFAELIAAAILSVAYTATIHAVIIIETVPIDNGGNPGDSRYGGYGAVSYLYNIGKYEVTAGQYTAFLNAVAGVDTNGLYHSGMAILTWGSEITQSGSGTLANPYVYSVSAAFANRPVNFIAWGDAARFANWLHNGQPTGPQDLTTTEDGSYFLNGAMSATEILAVTRKPTATWVITSEDEWYKAAFHKNDGVTGNYWNYPTSSDALPGWDITDASGNNANYRGGGPYPLDPPYYKTLAGQFQNSESPYGTFDQAGNQWEWNEAVIGSQRGRRGSSYNWDAASLHAQARFYHDPVAESQSNGFRVCLVSAPCTEPGQDCNSNGITDPCDISSGTSEDCNNNGVPDECDFHKFGGALSFSPPIEYSVGFVSGEYRGRIMSMGDLNGDGRPDLAIPNHTSNSISVLINEGNGAFNSHVTYGPVGQPACVTIGELNGDGRLDLICQTGLAVAVMLGLGDGTFSSPIGYPTGGGPNFIAVGDFNNDGKNDLAVGKCCDSVAVLIGNGNGSLQPWIDYPAEGGSGVLAIGDFNVDGKLDLAVANSTESVSILRGDGDGTFQAPLTINVPMVPAYVATKDLNRDGFLDLVVCGGWRDVAVLLGNGDATFKAPLSLGTGEGSNPISIGIGDLNGDGNPDLVVPHSSNPGTSVFLGDGDGTFPTGLLLPQSGTSLGVGDLNGDGRPDVAVVGWGGICCVRVSLNTTPFNSVDCNNDEIPDECELSAESVAFVSSRTEDSIAAFGLDSGELLHMMVPPGSGGLDYPNGMAVAANGDFYVCNAGNNTIMHFSGVNGALIRTFASPLLRNPSGVVLQEPSQLLVTNFLDDNVIAFNLHTKQASIFVASGAGGLDGPGPMLLRTNGNVLVSSQVGGKVHEYDANAAFVGIAAQGNGLVIPSGLLLDQSGNLIVANFSAGDVLKFGFNGAFLGVLVPAGSGGLTNPEGIAWGANGNLLVCNRFGANVLEYDGSSGAFVRVFADGIAEPNYVAASNLPRDCNANSIPDECEVNLAPTISMQPSGAVLCVGQSFSFTVAAAGAGLSYQWRKSGIHIPGATESSFTINPAAAGDTGSYDVVVSSSCGAVVSSLAALTVFAGGSADGNGDGAINGRDIRGFVNAILSGGPASSAYCAYDMNGDALVSEPDMGLFVSIVLN